MARPVTPKGAAAPAGSPTNREIDALAARARDGRFIKQYEAFIAFGYKPDPADTFQILYLTHFLRDLSRTSSNAATLATPASASPVPTAEGGKGRKARRAVNVQLLLGAHTFAACLKHLDRATPAEIEHLESHLSEALDLQATKREAVARASAAFAWRHRISQNIRLLSRLCRSGSPAQRRRLAGLVELHRDASRAYEAARLNAASERILHRRALGLPAPRLAKANRSRHRVTKAHRRFRRWWETVPATNAVSDSRKRSSAPRWRDLTESGLIYPHVAAGYSFGRTIAFSLNLSGEVEAKACTKPNPAAWLRDLIARHLEAALGRPVEVLVALELNGIGALHIHGIIAGVSLGEDEAVKSALKVAGGDYRGRQVLTKASPDSGWASYLAKDFLKPFKWSHRFAATRGLAAAARAVFDGMAAFVLGCDVSNTPDPADVKSTLTVRVTSIFENTACEAQSLLLNIHRHTSSAGEACISAHLRKNSSPTFGKACRSRDGPTPDG